MHLPGKRAELPTSVCCYSGSKQSWNSWAMSRGHKRMGSVDTRAPSCSVGGRAGAGGLCLGLEHRAQARSPCGASSRCLCRGLFLQSLYLPPEGLCWGGAGSPLSHFVIDTLCHVSSECFLQLLFGGICLISSSLVPLPVATCTSLGASSRPWNMSSCPPGALHPCVSLCWECFHSKLLSQIS